jgi:hypothetical protein
MALDYDLFRNVVAPEYATKTNEELDPFAEQAEIEITDSVWKTRYDRGVALLTAHLIKVSELYQSQGGTSSSGQLVETKVGDLRRKFAENKQSNGSYNLSTYGSEFLRLRKQVLMGPIFVTR